jgi:hypothetical protein
LEKCYHLESAASRRASFASQTIDEEGSSSAASLADMAISPESRRKKYNLDYCKAKDCSRRIYKKNKSAGTGYCDEHVQVYTNPHSE